MKYYKIDCSIITSEILEEMEKLIILLIKARNWMRICIPEDHPLSYLCNIDYVSVEGSHLIAVDDDHHSSTFDLNDKYTWYKFEDILELVKKGDTI